MSAAYPWKAGEEMRLNDLGYWAKGVVKDVKPDQLLVDFTEDAGYRHARKLRWVIRRRCIPLKHSNQKGG